MTSNIQLSGSGDNIWITDDGYLACYSSTPAGPWRSVGPNIEYPPAFALELMKFLQEHEQELHDAIARMDEEQQEDDDEWQVPI